jgi:5-methylcytosine-specific restriction endonuclease McrA
MPFKAKSCRTCGAPLVLVCKRDEDRKNYCSRKCRQLYRYKSGEFVWLKRMQELAHTVEANAKKGFPKEQHPKWIKDRTKVKQNRNRAEERWFFKSLLAQREFTCQLTGKVGGKLSVHHIKPVWSHPELRYDPENVVVIEQKIHKHFHRVFGLKSRELDWITYVQKKLYKLAA